MDNDFEALLGTSSMVASDKVSPVQPSLKTCCPSFSINNIHRLGGNMVCLSCGSVVDTIIESHEDDNSTSFHDSERCSKVEAGGDVSINYCSNTSFTSMTSRQRMFQQMSNEFKDICKVAELPPIMVKEMMSLYKEVYEKMSVRNYSVKRCNIKKGLIAACMYFACRKHKCARDIKEISEFTGLTRKGVSSGCTLFAEIMGPGYFDMPPMAPSEFIDRYMTKSNVPWKYYDEIAQLVKTVEQNHILHEVTPNGVCAGLIYHVLQTHNEATDIDTFSKTLRVSVTMIKKVAGRVGKESLA